jgi:hypothetical protein
MLRYGSGARLPAACLLLLPDPEIASRGLYIHGVTHVVNFEFPQVAEAYVHRISRPALDPLA